MTLERLTALFKSLDRDELIRVASPCGLYFEVVATGRGVLVLYTSDGLPFTGWFPKKPAHLAAWLRTKNYLNPYTANGEPISGPLHNLNTKGGSPSR